MATRAGNSRHACEAFRASMKLAWLVVTHLFFFLGSGRLARAPFPSEWIQESLFLSTELFSHSSQANGCKKNDRGFGSPPRSLQFDSSQAIEHSASSSVHPNSIMADLREQTALQLVQSPRSDQIRRPPTLSPTSAPIVDPQSPNREMHIATHKLLRSPTDRMLSPVTRAVSEHRRRSMKGVRTSLSSLMNMAL